MLDDPENESKLKRRCDSPEELDKPMKKSKHCRASKAKWTPEEDEALTRAVLVAGEGNWKKIAQSLNDRSHLQCLHRWQKVLNPALVKGPWKEEEDAKLSELVEKYGPKDWSTIASHIPGRIGKQCRERWFNHLSPDVRKTNWSPEEDKIIIDAHSKIGNKWTNISKLLDGRPANAIKNHWNSTLLKRIQDSAGEPTPRRDRRNKKPAPLRATEFDFRTHPQQFDNSLSPSQSYQFSPVSSPEYHEVPNMNTQVRSFHQSYPTEASHHAFFNPFAEQHAVSTLPVGLTNGSFWENWPTANVINLTQPSPSLPQVVNSSTNPGLSHSVPHIGSYGPHFTHANVHNAYDPEFGLSIQRPPEGFNELYSNASRNSTPVTETYNYEQQLQQQQLQQQQQQQQHQHLQQQLQQQLQQLQQQHHQQQQQQQQQPLQQQHEVHAQSSSSYDSGYPLSIDSSGVNIAVSNPHGNVLNMGLLNMDMGFTPLTLDM